MIRTADNAVRIIAVFIIIVVCALVVDFLLLPAILLTFDRRAVKYPLPNAALVGVASGAD